LAVFGVRGGGGDEVSAISEMCSWKRGERWVLLPPEMGVLSSIGTCSDVGRFGGW
jgi:hypothetical protein